MAGKMVEDKGGHKDQEGVIGIRIKKRAVSHRRINLLRYSDGLGHGGPFFFRMCSS